MQNKYSKKQIEELYNCEIFKDSDLGLWVAQAVQFTDDEEDCFFVQASGHDVDELHENIRKKIRDKREWSKELKFLRHWKSDVMEDLCKYDASSIDEIVHNARNKAIDELVEKLMEEQIFGCMLKDGFRADIATSHTIDTIAKLMKAGEQL